jgi:hypothetical protein
MTAQIQKSVKLNLSTVLAGATLALIGLALPAAAYQTQTHTTLLSESQQSILLLQDSAQPAVQPQLKLAANGKGAEHTKNQSPSKGAGCEAATGAK